MIAPLLLLLQTAPSVPLPLPPADWVALPTLRYLVPPVESSDLTVYVRDEVQAGRCAHALAGPGGWSVTVDLAVLVAPDGSPRRIVPRAIDCPSVEQYAAGLLSRRTRRNIDVGDARVEAWYKTTVRFSWPG